VQGCSEVGRKPLPEDWRLARSIFVGPDDAEAKAYVRDPNGPFAHYYGYIVSIIKRAAFHAIMKSGPEMSDDDLTPEWACNEFIIAGNPETVAEQILALREEVGPFGTIMMTATDCLDAGHKKKIVQSMRMMVEDVMPRVRRRLGESG